MNLSRSLRRCLPALLVTATLWVPARAGDDRDSATPTPWVWYHSQTLTQIGAIVNQGYRLVDLEIENPGTLTCSAAFVHNSGAYATPWWYLVNVDLTSLYNFCTTNNARIIDLEAWDGGGSTRYAAVMVANTGANAKLWWFYVDTDANSLLQTAGTNNARLVDIEQYTVGAQTRMCGVMIANTGADARAWWFYVGVSLASIGQHISTNGSRLCDFDQTSPTTFNCILTSNPGGTYWWYYVGLSDQQVTDIAMQNGARVIDVERVGSTFNVVMINNSNPLTTRVGDILRGTTDGWSGVYLKEANGPVLAALNSGRVFEPASTVKTLIHVHAMKQVANNAISLTTPLTVYTATSGSCPQDSSPVQEPLDTVLRLMMENSDNNRTQAAVARFGQANINATAAALALTGTPLNHRLGCGGPVPNQLTLDGIGKLHEAVVNGYLGTQRATFYDLMAESVDGYAGGEMANVLNGEAAALSLSASQLAAFKSRARIVWKGGSYTFLGPLREYRSWGAYVRLPFYGNTGAIVDREYVTGSFVDGASNTNNANTAFNRAAAEVLRDVVRAAMQTWIDYFPGSFTSFGAGCRGTNGSAPLHTGTAATGSPNIGTNVTYGVARARGFSPAAFYVGDSRSRWGSIPLPLALDFLGMTGCTLDVSLLVTINLTTQANGTAAIPLAFQNDRSFIGRHLFTQFAVVDVGANGLGLVHSNALDTLIGGLR